MLNKKKRELEAKSKNLLEKEENLVKRESELAKAIEEAETEEEVTTVTEEVENYEKEKEELDEEKKELEKKISDIDLELEELEDKSEEVEEETDKERSRAVKSETRNMEVNIKMGKTLFGGMTRDQVEGLVQRDDVKQFLERVRNLKGQQRAVTNADLLIPETLIGILRDNTHKYSKLISKVWLRPLNGTGRITIPGSIPEAVWTEACARLNELALTFNEVEVDGYKVGGFIPICNATLEDASDIKLYNEIMYMLAQAIGLAIDKAIVYGTGTKMPVGIVTRLAQATKPGDYSEKARKWVNLSTTNILQAAGSTEEKLFSDLILKTASAKGNYATGNKSWIMNETTFATLQSKLVTFNASGAIVASMNNTMPIIGGDIILLPFIPDGDIIGGYLSNYILAERAGMKLAVSEHVQFIEDNTVFKGTARYDGLPVIAEAFTAINISGGTVTKTMDFAPDTASTDPTPGV